MNSKIKFLSWALTALLMCANFTSCSSDDDDDEEPVKKEQTGQNGNSTIDNGGDSSDNNSSISSTNDDEEDVPYSSGDESHAKSDAVDLGLPSGTKWATSNIGATAPEDYGDYFAWGETEPKSIYNWSTYKFTDDGGSTFDKYTINGKTELEDADDVAVQLLGGDWQMPTAEQQEELRDNCYWVWTYSYKDKSVNGYIVYKVKDDADKGRKVYGGNTDTKGYDVDTDTHIFLPAAGYRYDAYLGNAGSYGYYRSRSLYTYAYGSNIARYLDFYSDFNSGFVVSGSYYGRNYGQSVRAVQRK